MHGLLHERGLSRLVETLGDLGINDVFVLDAFRRVPRHLFVDPAARGRRAGEAMLRHLDGIAGEQGWAVVRWITRDNNYRARGLYDRLAHRSDWITYEMTGDSTGRVT